MFNVSFHRRPAIALVAMLALSTAAPAFAQSTAPSPAPSPASSPAPTTFNSPFNGARDVKGEEGKDFSALMGLYDTMKDAQAALQGAKNCGGNVAAAQAALDAATTAFNTALAQYAYDWSSYAYTGIGVPLGGQTSGKFSQSRVENSDRFKKTDKPAILDALAQQDTKPHPVPGCPSPSPVPVSPAPSPSPSGVKDSALPFHIFLGLALPIFEHSHHDFDRDREMHFDHAPRIIQTDKY